MLSNEVLNVEKGERFDLQGEIWVITDQVWGTLPGFWAQIEDGTAIRFWSTDNLVDLSFRGRLTWLPPKKPNECFHTYTPYLGFTEKYEFCTKCSHKRF